MDVRLRKLRCWWRAAACLRSWLSLGAFAAYHSCSDAFAAVTEDIAGDQVDPAKDEDKDARRNDDPPKGHAERFLACCGLVEITKHVYAKDEHREREEDEAVSLAEEGPVALIVSAEETEFGGGEEHASDCGEDVADSIEEEELGCDRCLDEHDDAACNDCQEPDDVHDANDVEDDVAWTSQ